MAHTLAGHGRVLPLQSSNATGCQGPLLTNRALSKPQTYVCKATQGGGSARESHDAVLGTTSSGNQQDRSAARQSPQLSRRAALLALTSVLGAQAGSARAAEEASLPKEYRQLVRRLTDGLSEAIEVEASGAPEPEVRRRADPAKETVREFVRKWRDNPRVNGDRTHTEVKEALAELGEFYLAYGQRTKLTAPVRQSVLRHLDAAKAALPEEARREGAGILGGLF